MTGVEDTLGVWLSAALEDPQACDGFKEAVRNWFDQFDIETRDLSKEIRDRENEMIDLLGR